MKSPQLTHLFATFSTKFKDNLEKQFSPIGLHSGQVFVLKSLWTEDGQSQADLVKSLNVSPPTIYNMVVKLAALDFIEVKQDPMDARIMRVFLKAKGVAIKPDVEKVFQTIEEQIFGVLTETENMMCSLLLQKILDNLLLK